MTDTTTSPKPSRRDQILQALASMLEASPGERITTAGLAKQVGVSEAALYRHFPSKAKMFEGLIEFIESTLFSRISMILSQEESTAGRCQQILHLLLAFSERNPGITRILTGEPLAGESERLRARIAKLFDRLETQLRQVLREAELRDGTELTLDIQAAANLMLCVAEGRISQYVRSDFTRAPTAQWHEQWLALEYALFGQTTNEALPPASGRPY
jgi:TetR/AcrR family transcriptional regulator